ncbi:MAG: SNF2 helicase associated domain-containing protein, partial [Clostridioides sp.]|nr:SNF2 helicase associated domain-containing protein [Clostridioides sp.]
MIYKEFIDNIKKHAKKLKWQKGLQYLRNGLLEDIDVDGASSCITVKAMVNSDYSNEVYASSIDFDLIKHKISRAYCSCPDFRNNSSSNSIYLCKHLVATGIAGSEELEFYEKEDPLIFRYLITSALDPNSPEAKKFLDEVVVPEDEEDFLDSDRLLSSFKNNNTEKLNLKVKINFKEEEDFDEYDDFFYESIFFKILEGRDVESPLEKKYPKTVDISAEFKIGSSKKTYVVRNIKQFASAISDGTKLTFTPNFTFDPKIHYFDVADDDIINFIEAYGNAKSSYYMHANDKKYLQLNYASLKQLLKILESANKDFEFIFNDAVFTPKIKLNQLPVIFKIEKNDDKIDLDMSNFKPTFLSKKNDIILFDKNIYLLNNKQSESLNKIMDTIYEVHAEPFDDISKISFEKEQVQDVFNYLIPSLNSVVENINIDENIKKNITSDFKTEFYFDILKDQIYCDIKFIYYAYNNSYILQDFESENTTKDILRELVFNEVESPNANKNKKFEKINNNILYKDNLSIIDVDFKESVSLNKDSDNSISTKNLESENSLNEELRNLTSTENSTVICKEVTYSFVFSGNDDDLFNFVEIGINKLLDLGTVYYSSKFKNRKVYSHEHIHANFKKDEKGHYFKFDFNIDDVNPKELSDVIFAFRENKRFYKLKSGNFIDLQDKETQDFLNLLDNLGVEENKKTYRIPNAKAIYVQDYIKDKDFDFIEGKNIIDDISNGFKNLSEINFSVPENLNVSLRDYQLKGYNWFQVIDNYNFGGILADEMGLGKTIQTIAFLTSKNNAKSLIITPSSVLYNWKNEFEKFSPDLKIMIIHGTKREREHAFKEIPNYDVVLTTYGTFKNDVDMYEEMFFDYCIIDEAQNIKNPTAKITKAVKSINSKSRFALTGTPIENNLIELWSIFDFIMPDYLYSNKKFQNTYIKKETNLLNLKQLIKPFILRRRK